MNTTKVFDLIGIGIGPFNLGLAALCDDISQLKCIFIDSKPSFDWHPGMMIPGTRMQVPFYADLVTPVNPRSRYSFLNYLCENNRMYRFGINEQLFITRKEYNGYCQWVCSLLKNLHFNEICTLIEPSGENYKITTNKTFYYAKHIVIGIGDIPYIPKITNLEEHENVIHSSDYLFYRKRLLSQPSVTIIGSGQSAAEIFYDLLHQRDRFKKGLNWFTRAERFYPMEYSKLTLEMSTPEYIDFFFSLNKEKRDELFPKHSVLYKGINSNLINEIYNLLYEQWIEENSSPIHIEANCELTDIKKHGRNCTCNFYHRLLGQSIEHNTHAIVLATGFHSTFPDFLTPMRSQLQLNANDTYNAKRNYSIDAYDSIFIQNAEQDTHGFNAADLSLGPYRNTIILNTISKKAYFKTKRKIIFQKFGII
ncbi:lysine N(6)-hydroxylase/L-ornithine N(5)-oxygenase family protein [Niabella aurantiaca]|uniref:lysine N(6)-hydroxylase/L-ornithine N(5)-oxygenase family protein n=1 Tax=Niabella aurantiaca TaxID=379900 RepID=UPI000362237D|nr:SidA/IucD/PvdA family monooxygenase [Niabella aurantiaca]